MSDVATSRLSPAKRAALERLRAARTATAATAEPPPDPTGPVPLRSGTGPVALVLVNPVSGTLFCYAGLVAALRAEAPVYGFAGITPDGAVVDTDGGDPAGRIPRLARRYLAALRGTGGVPGRWVLAGWSFGGLVAYEMAHQVAAEGGPPPHTVLIDVAFYPSPPPEPIPDPVVRRWYVHDLARLAGVPADRLPEEFRRDEAVVDDGASLAELMARAGVAGHLPEGDVAARYPVFRANALGMAGYHPPEHAGPVTVVRAGAGVTPATDWRRFLRGPVTERVVPGDHYQVLSGGSVTAVAAAIDEVIGAAAAA